MAIELVKQVVLDLRALADAMRQSTHSGTQSRVKELDQQAQAVEAIIADATRFGDLREILVSLNEPNVMDTLGGLIESAADEVAARHPELTADAINELADVIIKTAREHADHT